MQDNKQKTIMFPIKDQNQLIIQETLQSVYNSLKEKGYNPINQIVGYILSEDPTYITNYNNARAVISKIDRDELLRVLVENFLTL
ncbi:MAG: IreB family regulatory phosphoprotein [Eubacteriales bacterium]|nr:IreB family regulatory phosphoprotein [Eubacteriales bacterium]MDD4421867.1 IreB family regulatory phosphoprotein [Eubacteriales bacterium]